MTNASTRVLYLTMTLRWYPREALLRLSSKPYSCSTYHEAIHICNTAVQEKYDWDRKRRRSRHQGGSSTTTAGSSSMSASTTATDDSEISIRDQGWDCEKLNDYFKWDSSLKLLDSLGTLDFQIKDRLCKSRKARGRICCTEVFFFQSISLSVCTQTSSAPHKDSAAHQNALRAYIMYQSSRLPRTSSTFLSPPGNTFLHFTCTDLHLYRSFFICSSSFVLAPLSFFHTFLIVFALFHIFDL